MQIHQTMIQRVAESHRLPDRGKELHGRANQIFNTNYAEINRFHDERRTDFAQAFRALLEAEIAHHQHVGGRRDVRLAPRRGYSNSAMRWCSFVRPGTGDLDSLERAGQFRRLQALIAPARVVLTRGGSAPPSSTYLPFQLCRFLADAVSSPPRLKRGPLFCQRVAGSTRRSALEDGGVTEDRRLLCGLLFFVVQNRLSRSTAPQSEHESTAGTQPGSCHVSIVAARLAFGSLRASFQPEPC